jgi:hypothetical protein
MDFGVIGFEVIISVISGMAGAIGAYVKLKSSIDVLIQKDVTQQNEINNIKEGKKEMNVLLHKRIDVLKKDLTQLQVDVTKGHNSLQTLMAQMELRIVKEIQKIQR